MSAGGGGKDVSTREQRSSCSSGAVVRRLPPKHPHTYSRGSRRTIRTSRTHRLPQPPPPPSGSHALRTYLDGQQQRNPLGGLNPQSHARCSLFFFSSFSFLLLLLFTSTLSEPRWSGPVLNGNNNPARLPRSHTAWLGSARLGLLQLPHCPPPGRIVPPPARPGGGAAPLKDVDRNTPAELRGSSEAQIRIRLIL